MKTVAIYTRVSTQEQSADGYSLGEQEERLKLYAKAHDWAVARVYTDPGFSGAKLERPAMQQMISDCKGRLFDAVLVYKLDRLSRSQKDTLYLIEDVFNPNNIGLVSMRENFDTQTPFGKAMIGILSVFAQLERDQITERMNMGRIGRAKAGYYSGGSRPPVGYTYSRALDGEKKTLEIDEYEAMQVREIFDLFLRGKDGKEMSMHAITLYMHDRYKTRYGDWSFQSSVARVLQDRTYIGEVRFSGKWYHGIHNPIIDQETFDAAQKKLARISESAAGSFSENFKGGYLLSGLLVCGVCGSRYFARTWRKRNRKSKEKGPDSEYNRKYCCYTASSKNKKMSAPGGCNNIPFEMGELDETVISEVRKLRMDPSLVMQEAALKKPTDKQSAILSRIEDLKKQEGKLVDLYQIGSIDLDIVKERSEALRSERESLENELAESDPNPANVSVQQAEKLLSSFDEVFVSGTLQDKRELLRGLIDKIVLFPDKHIEIHWSFSAK